MTHDGNDRGISIRALRIEDAGAIADLFSMPNVRRGTLSLPFTSQRDVRLRLEGRPVTDINIVALCDGTLVGEAYLHRYVGRRAHVGSIAMGVHDDFLRRGIGTALLRELVDAADNWLGLLRLELQVFADNEPAIALYRRFAFEVEGTLKAFALRNGQLTDALSMARLKHSVRGA
jgi:putative acetyltransferase